MPHTPLPITNRLFRRLLQAIERAPMDRAGKERLTHFAMFVLFGVPMLLAFCASNLMAGDLLLAALIFVASMNLLLGWLLLCHLPLGRIVYRVCAVIYGGFLLYVLVMGGEGGSKSLWMLTYPFFIVFLVGIKEGLAWSILLLAATLALLLVPLPGIHPFPYSHAFIVRFASVYAITAAIACWSEHFRLYYRTSQEQRLSQLKAVIDGLPDAVRLDDHTGRPLLCNPAYLAMTGLSSDEAFDEEMPETPETPPGMEPCTIPLPAQAGEVYQLLIWRERRPGGSPEKHLSAASRDTAGQVTAGHCDPASDGEPESSGNPARSSTPPAAPLPATILLAEDEAMLRQVGTQMLAGLGYQVLAAADGEEALALYRTHQQHISLVLCDQYMPRLNGWQLLAALRLIDPSVPVIMISGAAANPTEGPETVEQPNASLDKPYSMGLLQQTIQQVLSPGQKPTA